MEEEIVVRIPELWGNQEFRKNTWGPINYLIGPNGTGKTLFAERLKGQCEAIGLRVRYVNAERIVGLERHEYTLLLHSYVARGLDLDKFSNYKELGRTCGAGIDALLVLREKLDVRLKVETILEDYLGRRLRLCEEGGFLRPKLRRMDESTEYDFKQGECHGLKELVTLLGILYDDEYNCLIIDEPEMHLHPQFQSFFLQQVRSVAGDPFGSDSGKKLVFLVTHSPYCIDIRSVDDIYHCLVFTPGRPPTFVAQLEDEDKYKLRRLIPRLNTHHKQFFFSTRPVFVEGYQDQQLYTLIQEQRGRFVGAWGVSIIDVGGKDELDLFFRLCRKLSIDAHFITDLDAVFRGKLRQSVALDERCQRFIQQEGLGTELMKLIGELEQEIDSCIKDLLQEAKCEYSLNELKDALSRIDKDNHPKRRFAFTVGLARHRELLQQLLPNHNLEFIRGRLEQICRAMKCAGVHVLKYGELAHYLPTYQGNPYLVSDNAKHSAFEEERQFLLTNELSEQELMARYGALVEILDNATGSRVPDFAAHLNQLIADWIHMVQSAVFRGEVKDVNSLVASPLVRWNDYTRIFDLVHFEKKSMGFTCSIRLKANVDPRQREVHFDDNTVAAKYQLPT